MPSNSLVSVIPRFGGLLAESGFRVQFELWQIRQILLAVEPTIRATSGDPRRWRSQCERLRRTICRRVADYKAPMPLAERRLELFQR